MTEKDKICDKIKELYDEWRFSHHSAYVNPADFVEWKKKTEAELDELCRRIRNLKE